ncbi:hypothetical protein ACFOU2_20655 [Bacillus songklensis]|uniref:Lipoyl-binding domain-containing protein n=1 Tax=Bacillus songklensis TaxID=1069116 RepID=A0ABV8B667_9BACI
MKSVIETIYSPCSGTVEKVLTKESSHVYEWERLFLIKTNDGKLEEVKVGISGYITSLQVQPGEKVNEYEELAKIKDDFIITGCD